MLDYPPENSRSYYYCYFYKNENLTVQEKRSSEPRTRAGVFLPQTKWKEGEINEYDVAFYLVIAVIHRLLPGAAEALTTEHYSFSPWHLLWDLHQSSPLRGYESKCVGTNNMKKPAAHFFFCFLWKSTGTICLIHSWAHGAKYWIFN